MSGVLLRGLTAFSVAICSLSAAWCGEVAAGDDHENSQELIFSEVTENGLFFLNGKHIEAPYTVEATEETISVNGIAVSVESKPFRGGFNFDHDRGFRGRGRRSGFGNRSHLGNPDRSDDEPRSEFQPRTDFRNRWTANRVAEALDSNQFLLLFEQTGELIFVPEEFQHELCGTLIDKSSATERLQSLAGPGAVSRETTALWKEWLQNYTPPEQLVNQLTAMYDEGKQLEDENNREIAAMDRLESYSYPLTLLGMVVGVVALGHLLRWPRKEDELEPGSQTVRAVEIALWLMLGMALIDLAWTVLATQAGVMKEVNPVAEKLVSSPLQLAIFKTFATGIGFGIFYLWRQRRQIQVATWWMCLVCVLVTFRWIIFDSAISP